eukprot:3577863-Rhodomonas_salina.1
MANTRLTPAGGGVGRVFGRGKPAPRAVEGRAHPVRYARPVFHARMPVGAGDKIVVLVESGARVLSLLDT